MSSEINYWPVKIAAFIPVIIIIGQQLIWNNQFYSIFDKEILTVGNYYAS